MIRVGGWGGGWVKKIKKNFRQEIINKKIYSYGFWPKEKKICPWRICAGIKRLFKKNYEVNDKSRLEIKHDFFNLSMIHE